MTGRVTAVIAMRPDVAAAALPARLRARLDSVADVDHDLVVTDFADPGARAALACADVLLTGWGCPLLDGPTLDAAPHLRAVIHAAGSLKHHLGADFWTRGLVASSAADANAYPVAQFTVSALLLAGKRTFRVANAYARGDFRDLSTSQAFGNADRTVGVIGASRIGRLVLGMLAGHGFHLLLADPTLTPAEAAGLGAELVGLDDLFSGSDMVSVHAPSLPETRHLIDDRCLGLLRDGAILVNTARGSLVDTEALTRHCASGRIDAVLDVTDPEPLPTGHPLFSLPNVLVTPHLAGAMGTEVSRLGEFAVAEVERLARGLPLVGAVSAEDLARIA
ncbi:hydroxyacid dehydrogenase [Catenulispora pinisilvae]|uniref:hydroxyacid dehydrogenase n=1 Tax=Catenulispora pinisilvae TaxID=2705253 RepID=UPI0018912673|nr:hydroxyacid dehydrogenase [Catenulispora pinisilvae]